MKKIDVIERIFILKIIALLAQLNIRFNIRMTYLVKRGNKYNAKSTAYAGQVYHSKMEATRAYELDMLQKAGEIKNIERQVRYQFWLVRKNKQWFLTDISPSGKENIHICDYYLDFRYQEKNGTIVLEEVKGGKFMASLGNWKFKWRLLEALYGSDFDYKLSVIQ